MTLHTVKIPHRPRLSVARRSAAGKHRARREVTQHRRRASAPCLPAIFPGKTPFRADDIATCPLSEQGEAVLRAACAANETLINLPAGRI